jgi:hypothetical protein
MEKREGKSNAQKRGRADAVWVGQTCAPRVQEQRGLSGVPCVRWTRAGEGVEVGRGWRGVGAEAPKTVPLYNCPLSVAEERPTPARLSRSPLTMLHLTGQLVLRTTHVQLCGGGRGGVQRGTRPGRLSGMPAARQCARRGLGLAMGVPFFARPASAGAPKSMQTVRGRARGPGQGPWREYGLGEDGPKGEAWQGGGSLPTAVFPRPRVFVRVFVWRRHGLHGGCAPDY